jgi:phage host-nuclease inhibitor protein Gam
MDDQKILQHLLNLEAEAAALVNDAQAEADRRVAEGERQNRVRYDDVYAREVEALETSYAGKIAELEDSYRKQLEEYRESLKAVSLDMQAFCSQAEKAFFNVLSPNGKP